MMEKKEVSENKLKDSYLIKSGLLYGAAAGSNIYFLIFGVTFDFIPLMLFQFLVIILTIYFSVKYI